jgi:hypothetical protein
MAAGSGDWYIRSQGRVLGPFNWSQLLSLRDRGQLSQSHEVSQDRRSWTKSADVPGLYAQAVNVRHSQQSAGSHVEWPAIALDDGSGSSATEAGPELQDQRRSWYIPRGDSHHGPLLLRELQQLIDTGEMGPKSLVWKDGMPTWIPASQVSELRFKGPSGASSAGLAPHPGSADGSRPVSNSAQHTSGLAIASLILGVVWLCGLGSLLATIFGAIALSQVSRSNGTITGKGLALAGLILGILGLIVVAVPFAFGFVRAILEQSQRAQ